jgi:hypothetical protein
VVIQAHYLAAQVVLAHHKPIQMQQEQVDKDLLVVLALQQQVTAAVEAVLEPQERLVWVQHPLLVRVVSVLI